MKQISVTVIDPAACYCLLGNGGDTQGDGDHQQRFGVIAGGRKDKCQQNQQSIENPAKDIAQAHVFGMPVFPEWGKLSSPHPSAPFRQNL